MDLDKNAAVVKELRTLFNVGVAGDLTDGQLLERFATDRGEAAELAFTVLVERHGPMVLRVCRSVLAGEYEADDVFQATFLVLVKKARGLWVRDSLGPWLHQVAFRTASRARRGAALRRRHEEHAAAARPEAHTMNHDDLDGLLHEEIEKLPERYRAPLVLCDLEGCSHQQAARHLGWPLGTVKSRQARGRERLRDRLRHRSLAPNLGLLGTGRLFTTPDPAVSQALLESTTRSVVQFVTCQTAVNASTLALAQGVLKVMSITRWTKAASVLLVLGTTVSGAGIYAQRRVSAAQRNAENRVETTRANEPITFRVAQGKIEFTIAERGRLEAAHVSDEFCNIEGGTSIMRIVPEGTHVKKGETIVELDSSSLRDQLTNSQLAIESALVDYRNAVSAREIADLALHEYIDGIFKQDLDAVKGEVATAESSIQKGERRLDRARRARQQLADLVKPNGRSVAPADILAELELEDRIDSSEQSISLAKAALELARSKQRVLEKFTRNKTVRELTLEAERKRPDELAKQARWQFEQSKAKKLERQIAACTIKASEDGTVVYAETPRNLAIRPANPRIEAGSQVRERQKILRLFDPSGPKLVIANVRESHVDKLRQGMTARIRVDAFPDQLFSGTVVEVSPVPDPPVSPDGGRKVYTTKLKLENGAPFLRPGMVTEIEFVLGNLENAVSVPVEAVVVYERKPHVAVRAPGGSIEFREVTMGLSSEKWVEITKGIEIGDAVVLNPVEFMSGPVKPSVTQPSTSSESSRTPQGRKP